jgi:exodeoxyribonuclease V alpha subunit
VSGGFDAGDRVVVGTPLAQRGLLRGETGTVGAADADGVTVVFDAPVGEVRLGADEVGALRHAWALTVAEAQGGRWPAVVAVFDAEAAPALTRATTLGAITLATKHVSVVHGAGRALAEAVENIPDRERHTRLRHALKD